MKGKRVGYIRVSSVDQNTVRQLEGIRLDRVFTDKASGKDTKRPQLEALLEFVREGDLVVCHSMDRLARNLDDLRKLVMGLTKRGIRVEFVKEALTFTGEDSPMATLLLNVMGSFAQFERVRRKQGSPATSTSAAKPCTSICGRSRILGGLERHYLRRYCLRNLCSRGPL